jgi:hypothetical protein
VDLRNHRYVIPGERQRRRILLSANSTRELLRSFPRLSQQPIQFVMRSSVWPFSYHAQSLIIIIHLSFFSYCCSGRNILLEFPCTYPSLVLGHGFFLFIIFATNSSGRDVISSYFNSHRHRMCLNRSHQQIQIHLNARIQLRNWSGNLHPSGPHLRTEWFGFKCLNLSHKDQ